MLCREQGEGVDWRGGGSRTFVGSFGGGGEKQLLPWRYGIGLRCVTARKNCSDARWTNSYKEQTTFVADCAVVVQSALKGCTSANFIIAVLLSLLAEVTGTRTSDYGVDFDVLFV